MTFRPELVGGHLAVDLVNTVAWRLDAARVVDRFAELPNLAVWLEAAGVGRVEPTRRLRDELVVVRETAYDVLAPLAVGAEPGRKQVAALQDLVAGVVRSASMRMQPFRWEASGAAAVARLAVWRLFEDEDLSRLRQCDDDGCGWLFLDRSKNGSRRWCSSADCGNRARGRRHYQKSRGS
jgi:predicted RNA-binding Zn ribbon-like protein